MLELQQMQRHARQGLVEVGPGASASKTAMDVEMPKSKCRLFVSTFSLKESERVDLN